MNYLPSIILANLFMILIYLVYKGAFSQSHFFQANRFFLLTGVASALALPWISPAMDFLKPSTDIQWLQSIPAAQQDGAKQAGGVVVEPISRMSASQLILGIYLAIIAVMSIIFAIQWIRLKLLWRNAPVQRYGQLKVKIINKGWSAFSYFRTVYCPEPFDPTLPETKVILEHELVHARQLHTLDNIFFGICRLVFFFNPFIHLLHKELMITHEYLADHLTSGSDRLGYSKTLISHQFKIPRFVLMHPFHTQSFLKRRLNMLSKNTQNHLAGWKYMLVLPLFGGMILGSSWSVTAQDKNQRKKTETAAKVEKQLKKLGFVKTGERTWSKDGWSVMATDSVTVEQLNASIKELEEFKIKKQSEEAQQVFLIVEEMPKFEGGEINDFRNWVQSNLKYPAEAKDKKISGTVYVTFVVNTKGEVVNTNIIRSVDPILDAEVIRVLKFTPAWKPGKQRGKAVNVSFSIPVSFALSKSGDMIKPPANQKEPVKPEEEDKIIFVIVEEMPEFEGGTLEKFRGWAQARVKYPQKAMEESKSGTVEVSFTVNKKGEVEDVQIVKSADPILDEAVMNVVKSSPIWKPGKQRGRLVKVSQTIPIKFILN
ncbi:MAG: M56 family metallopeptidase [Bacteroidales bacterium]